MLLPRKSESKNGFGFFAVVATLTLSALVLNTCSVYAVNIVGRAAFEEDWIPIAHFTFDSVPGRKAPAGHIEGRLKAAANGVNFVVYDDEDYSWNTLVKDPSMSCEEKLRLRQDEGPAKSVTLIHSGVTKSSLPFSTTLDVDVFESVRPRTWHFVLAKCGSSVGSVNIDLKLTNPSMGWLKEFSKDEQMLFPLNTICIFAYYCLTRKYNIFLT